MVSPRRVHPTVSHAIAATTASDQATGGGGVVRKWVVPHLHETLYVGYAEPGNEYGILFTFSLFCEYYVRVHVIYRVNQAEYGIHILVVAPQECVNICSTRRYATRGEIG